MVGVMESAPDDRSAPAGPGLGSWFGCAVRSTRDFSVVAVLVDAASLTLSGSGGVSAALRVLVVSLASAVLCAGAAALAALGVTGASVAPIRSARRRGLVAGIVFGLMVGCVLWLAGGSLLSGRGISGQPWIGTARLVFSVSTWGVVPLAMAVAWSWRARRAAAGSWAASRVRRFVWWATAAIGAVFVGLDWTVYPLLYPVGHIALWFLVGLCVFVLRWLRPRGEGPASFRTAACSVAVLAAAAAVLWIDPLSGDSTARASAFRQTRFLRRALPHLRAISPDAARPIDPATLDRLRAGGRLDGETLDRAIPGRRKLNVVFISIDALRADRLHRNGYARDLTPNLDALLAKGTYFRSAWTIYPYTMFAFSGLFRGCYASGTDAYPEILRPGTTFAGTRKPTLGGLLSAAGWRSEAVVGFPTFVCSYFRRDHEGFGALNKKAERSWFLRPLVAEEVTSLALDALDRDPDKPFFLWVHYFDPHAPYDPPGDRPFGTAKPDLYDNEILYMDRELGRFLDGIRARGRMSDTAFFVLSDHGEDLVEFDHGTALTEEQIHVPVGIVIPGAEPREIGSPVDLASLMPTALELLGLPIPATVHGRSLLPFVLLGDAKAESRGAFPPPLAFVELGSVEEKRGPPPQLAVRENDWKLVHHADADTYSVFDLRADPQEAHDVAPARPDMVEHLRGILDAFRAMTR